MGRSNDISMICMTLLPTEGLFAYDNHRLNNAVGGKGNTVTDKSFSRCFVQDKI